MLGVAGITAMERRAAGVTVRPVEPDTLPRVAVIVTGPWPRAVASPFDPAELLTAATPAFVELQVTAVVRFCVDLSVKVPVAVNCCVVPPAMLGFAGITAIDTRVAGVTVKVVDPETAALAAIIVVDPGLTAVANPLEPDALLTEATVVAEEVQATVAVRFCVELSV